MAFGKPGRPPEDRVTRRREIYEAVAPLLLSVGARQLSMQAAARAACVSIGGLYHYFPTKRELVLHGLDADARDQLCRDFRAGLAHLEGQTLDAAIGAYLDHSLMMFAFLRPSARAALELGVTELQMQLDLGLTRNVGELAETLRILAPELPQRERETLGRAIRRVALGAMLDEQVEMDEVRDQLHLVIEGFLGRIRRTTTPAGAAAG